MIDHTKGLLEIDPICSDGLVAGSRSALEPQDSVATCGGQSTETNVANAARIRACWNACLDIPTESLALGVVARLVAACRKTVEAHESLFAQCLSNPIINAWGEEVNVGKINEAHEAAKAALALIPPEAA